MTSHTALTANTFATSLSSSVLVAECHAIYDAVPIVRCAAVACSSFEINPFDAVAVVEDTAVIEAEIVDASSVTIIETIPAVQESVEALTWLDIRLGVIEMDRLQDQVTHLRIQALQSGRSRVMRRLRRRISKLRRQIRKIRDRLVPDV